MKLEQQVTSLEISKKLKELGVKQESLFWHTRISDTPDGRQDWLLRDTQWGQGALEEYSAFTVAELGKMLPRRICDAKQTLSGVEGKCYSLIIEGLSDDYCNENIINGWRLRYGDTKVKVDSENKLNSAGIYYVGTEADARGKMLIYLIENNLLKTRAVINNE